MQNLNHRLLDVLLLLSLSPTEGIPNREYRGYDLQELLLARAVEAGDTVPQEDLGSLHSRSSSLEEWLQDMEGSSSSEDEEDWSDLSDDQGQQEGVDEEGPPTWGEDAADPAQEREEEEEEEDRALVDVGEGAHALVDPEEMQWLLRFAERKARLRPAGAPSSELFQTPYHPFSLFFSWASRITNSTSATESSKEGEKRPGSKKQTRQKAQCFFFVCVCVCVRACALGYAHVVSLRDDNHMPIVRWNRYTLLSLSRVAGC